VIVASWMVGTRHMRVPRDWMGGTVRVDADDMVSPVPYDGMWPGRAADDED
jgi:hypothetical protein